MAFWPAISTWHVHFDVPAVHVYPTTYRKQLGREVVGDIIEAPPRIELVVGMSAV